MKRKAVLGYQLPYAYSIITRSSAITQAVRCQLLMVETLIKFQCSNCEICLRQGDTGTDFSPNTLPISTTKLCNMPDSLTQQHKLAS